MAQHRDETPKIKSRGLQKSSLKVAKKIVGVSLLVLLIVAIGLFLYMLYGPDIELRDMYVTTVLQTSALKFMATAFFPQETIDQILEANKVIPAAEQSDPSLITIATPTPSPTPKPTPSIPPDPTATPEPTPTPTPTPKLFSDLENANPLSDDLEGIQLLDIDYKGSHGYMLVVMDPSRVSVGITNELGTKGQKLLDMVETNNAIAGINGGSFLDINGHGTGGIPLGCVMSNGNLITWEEGLESIEIIGFNENNVLVIGNYTQDMLRVGKIRDCVTFGPMLIVNGELSEYKGNGGGGTQPRTAIAQRQDGVVLMLVMDGRQASSPGVTYRQMAEILLEYGAYNAANLDGGSSSTIVLNHELLNHPCGPAGARYLPTGFLVK